MDEEAKTLAEAVRAMFATRDRNVREYGDIGRVWSQHHIQVRAALKAYDDAEQEDPWLTPGEVPTEPGVYWRWSQELTDGDVELFDLGPVPPAAAHRWRWSRHSIPEQQPPDSDG